MNYKCIYFDIKELVDQTTIYQFGDSSWMFLQPKALIALDNIRAYFGKPVTVNDWSFGGQLRNRGFRSSFGSDYSQHRLGNAFDIDIQGVSAEEARQKIIQLKDSSLFYFITCMETGTSWLHFDCRNIPDRIRLVAG